MQIVEHDRQRASLGGAAQEDSHCVEQPELPLLFLVEGSGLGKIGDQLAHVGEDSLQVFRFGSQQAAYSLRLVERAIGSP